MADEAKATLSSPPATSPPPTTSSTPTAPMPTLSLHQFIEALSDAEKTVELKPDWTKGYSCLGTVHMGRRRLGLQKG